MSNMYGKDKFHDRQKAVLQKSAQKIENTVDNEIADESNLIFEFLIGNENYTDWQ